MDAIRPPAGSQGRIVDLSFLSEEEQAKIKGVLDRSVDVIKEEEMRLESVTLHDSKKSLIHRVYLSL